jgi:hypothetical protein
VHKLLLRLFRVINRPLTQQERDDALPRETQPGVEPDQRLGMVRINSTYVDWIDRRFLFRGGFKFVAIAIGIAAMLPLIAYLLIWEPLTTYSDDPAVFIAFSGFLLNFLLLCGLYYLGIRFEIFTYTYWPIRFNRKTRMVHVFRHNGPGGVLSVPWDQVFFHIGRGWDRKELRDIRGEVLDGDTIVDMFALGHAASSERPVREMWEFIRRYMDEGPDAVASHPLEKYVELSVAPTLRNCYLMMYTYYGAGFPLVIRIIATPFIWLYTLTRWLVLLTCRQPVFPPEVEATCQVDADDPNVWPIPDSAGQFARDVPGVIEHAREKAKRQWEAAHNLSVNASAGHTVAQAEKPKFRFDSHLEKRRHGSHSSRGQHRSRRQGN